jgi:hypothetical protein
MNSSSMLRKPSQYVAAVILLSIISACSTSNNDSDSSAVSTTVATAAPMIGEPVTDFNAIFKNRSAIDHSFISVDADGIYGVLVTKEFDFMQYMTTGWISITSSIAGITAGPKGQIIDGVPVEKAMDVTTRDYTGDRESDFLLRFGSTFSKFGSIANSRNGLIELKPFCLSNPSPDRPGVIRVFAVENLSYSDQYKIIEGDDIGADGYHLKEYWRWRKKNSCFKTTSSL